MTIVIFLVVAVEEQANRALDVVEREEPVVVVRVVIMLLLGVRVLAILVEVPVEEVKVVAVQLGDQA